MIKMISKSTLLTLIMVLSATMVMANDWAGPVTICYSAPQTFVYSGPNYAIYAPQSAEISMPSGQAVIANFEPTTQTGIAAYDVLNDGQSISFTGAGPFGSPDMYVRVTGTGWFKITEYYGNAFGGGTSDERWVYVYTSTSGLTSFNLNGSATCPSPYTDIKINRQGWGAQVPFYKFQVDVQEVDAAMQVVAGGVSYSTGMFAPGTVTTDKIRLVSTAPSNIPAGTVVFTGVNLPSGKQYRITLSAETPCDANNVSSSTYFSIGNCTPTPSIALNGVTVRDNGIGISSYCSAINTIPVTVSTTVPTGAPPVTQVKFYLQQVSNSACNALIGSEIPYIAPAVTNSYDLRTMQAFTPHLSLNGASAKYFKVKVETKNDLGTVATSYQCFRISNNQLINVGFNFLAGTGSIIDTQDNVNDGLVNTASPPSAHLINHAPNRGYMLGRTYCGISVLPANVGQFNNYRVEILRRSIFGGAFAFTPIFDSGVINLPSTLNSFTFNSQTIQGIQGYFDVLSNINLYDYQCRLSLQNDCGWVSTTKPFYITTACTYCRPSEGLNPDAEGDNTKADFEVSAFSMEVSPNPSDGQLSFELTNINQTAETTLTVLDMTGKVIDISIIAPDIITLQKDYSALPAGIYIYRAQNGSQIAVGKFIKN